MKFYMLFIFVSSLSLVSCSTKKGKKEPGSPETSGGQSAQAATAPIILGLWRSPSPDPAGNGHYMTREYNFTDSRWEMTQTLAADKDMKKTIYVYRAEGTYHFFGPSKKVPGAYETDFKINRKFLNLRTKDKALAKELDLNACKLSVGKEKDISNDNCSSFKSIKECPQEFDLVKVEAAGLRMGDRPSDGEMCSAENRPEMLGGSLKKLN